MPSDVAGASKRDRIRSDVVNSRLPDPRLDLIYRLEASVGDPQDVGQISVGHRRIVPLNGGTFSGPELRGTLLPGASADWQTVLPDGTVLGDVRYTLETESGEMCSMFGVAAYLSLAVVAVGAHGDFRGSGRCR